jgi:hypothetical protein
MFANHNNAIKKAFLLGSAGMILVILLTFGLVSVAWAHQTIQVGDYAVEYGWVNEPAIVNQANAVVVNLTGPNEDTNVDASGLLVKAVFGGEQKVLTLQPLGENTPGQYMAPITPTRPGTYTIHFGGTINSTNFNNDVQPEEVQTADLVQFPAAIAPSQNPNSSPLGLTGWLGITGIILGVIGILLGGFALSRKPAKG